MKRISKYQKAQNVLYKMNLAKALNNPFAPSIIVGAFIRQAYLKGYKAGMAKSRRIVKNREFIERFTKAMNKYQQ